MDIKGILKRWLAGLSIESAPQELRVLLLRTGEWEMSGLPTDSWPLTSKGKQQAVEAGRRIKDLLSGETPTVLLSPSGKICYRQTATIIATVLGVEPVLSDLQHAPEWYELAEAITFGGPLVVVVNGTYLNHQLFRLQGPDVSVSSLGPPFGSVHQLVITYRPATPFGYPTEVSRRFV